MVTHDAYRVAARLRQLAGSDELVQRIVSPALHDAMQEAYGIALRSNFGFVNRTHRLRRSLRIEQARDVRGRYSVSVQLVASTPYAAYVEYKRRTRDKRAGPPYWLERAFHLAESRMRARLRASVSRSLGLVFARAPR